MITVAIIPKMNQNPIWRIGISSAIGTDTKDAHISNTDIVVVDALAISSQIHWSELKARGMFKHKQNPTAIAPNTSKSKEIDDFLSKLSSKSKYNSKHSNKNIISGNSAIDNDCISQDVRSGYLNRMS